MTKKLRFLLILFLGIISNSINAQNLDISDIIKKLDSIDKEALSTKYFLNRGFLNSEYIADFQEFKENKEDNFIVNNKNLWRKIYRGLRKSYTGKNQRIPKIDFKALKNRYKSEKNLVPLGILQVKGEWLEPYEVDENIKAKVEGYELSKNYKKLHIFNGSALKKKVYSGTVNFEIAPEAYYIKNRKQIKSIEVDLGDGRGYRSIGLGDVLTANYESTGEKSIGIKFNLKNKSFISYSDINVVTLNEEEPTMIFELGDSSESAKGASTAKANLSGGTAALFNGCDLVFDRPVIIVEGFDALNDLPIADIRSKYDDAGIEDTFRANGFDVIYLNFTRGGNDIRTNATVLENLIRDVNRQKIGNRDIIVIGESMGGLVARYALTRLERGRYTHNVSHYISFDSPHKGANVPVGFQTIVKSVDDLNFREFFNIRQGDIDEANNLLNSKAARQMLLRYKGPNPHPDFTSLQREFDNTGFPSQGGIRNISISNGAVDGSTNDPFMQYTPGSRIIQAEGNLFGIIAGRARIRTNVTNGRGRVSSLYITTGGIPTTIKEKSFSFNAFNYDLASGGWQDNQGVSSIGQGNLFGILRLFGIFADVTDYGNSNFSFVPFFSSSASTAPLRNQADLNRSENQLINNNWTEFDRIFGSNINTRHIETLGNAGIGWRNMFTQELRIPITGICRVNNTSAAPPSPRINGRYFYMCELNSETLRIDNPSSVSNLYTHRWRVTGPQSFTRNGETLTMFRGLRPGRYTVRATRTYNAASGVAIRSSTSSRVFTVFSQYDRIYGCNEGDDGGPIRKSTIDTTEGNEITEELVLESSINPWPNPVTDELNVNYTMLAQGNVSISLQPLYNVKGDEITITNSYRPQGNYQETYYTTGLKNGLYILRIRAGKKTIDKKIIINR